MQGIFMMSASTFEHWTVPFGRTYARNFSQMLLCSHFQRCMLKLNLFLVLLFTSEFRVKFQFFFVASILVVEVIIWIGLSPVRCKLPHWNRGAACSSHVCPRESWISHWWMLYINFVDFFEKWKKAPAFASKQCTQTLHQLPRGWRHRVLYHHGWNPPFTSSTAHFIIDNHRQNASPMRSAHPMASRRLAERYTLFRYESGEPVKGIERQRRRTYARGARKTTWRKKGRV
jgi:hypothetical protein